MTRLAFHSSGRELVGSVPLIIIVWHKVPWFWHLPNRRAVAPTIIIVTNTFPCKITKMAPRHANNARNCVLLPVENKLWPLSRRKQLHSQRQKQRRGGARSLKHNNPLPRPRRGAAIGRDDDDKNATERRRYTRTRAVGRWLGWQVEEKILRLCLLLIMRRIQKLNV